MNRPMTAVAAMLMLVAAAGTSFAASVSASNGKLIVDAKPFFPFGFVANVGDPLRDLDAVGTNGFNTIHCNNMCNDGYYARAAQLGVRVIQETWWTNLQISVTSSRDKGPLIAYYVADDMNFSGSCSSPRYTPDQVAARTSLIKSYDYAPPAQHFTTGALVLSSGCAVSNYAGKVDILQGFNYPIENWGDPSGWLETNARAVKSLVSAGGGRWPVIADNQSFAWPGKRLPTPRESRNMNYAALALGVSGIMMYSISEPNGFYLPVNGPDLWRELKAQAAEVRTMSDMLLNGTRQTLSVQPYIYAAAWTQGARTLVIAVNTDRINARTVSLELPAGSSPTVAFPRLGGTLQPSGSKLTGSIRPEAVQVYKNY